MLDRYFEEYAVGERWVSRGRTITEADVVNFAGFSGDWFSLHVDAEYAARTRFGRRVAHGMLVLSAGTGLLRIDPDRVVAFYGMDRVRFTAPVYIGDTIHLELEVEGLEERGPGDGLVVVGQRIVNQRGETVAVATLRMLVRRRP